MQKNLLRGFFRTRGCRIDSGSGSGPEQIEKVQDGYARRILSDAIPVKGQKQFRMHGFIFVGGRYVYCANRF